MLSDWILRLRALLRPAKVESEIDAELKHHIERQVEVYVARGMDPAEAARKARLEFGGLEQIKEEYRDALGVRPVADFTGDLLWRDVGYGLRSLRKHKGYTALAVLTLGLGIGASTTIFSVVQNVLLDPFPYDDMDRVVNVRIVDQTRPRALRMRFWADEVLDYKEQSQSFEDVIGGANGEVLYTAAGGGAERFNGGYVTPNNFRFLGHGAEAIVGRTFTEDDARPGAPPVCLLRHEVWVARFAADPGLVGKTFVLNGVPTTLVGVMQPRF